MSSDLGQSRHNYVYSSQEEKENFTSYFHKGVKQINQAKKKKQKKTKKKN